MITKHCGDNLPIFTTGQPPRHGPPVVLLIVLIAPSTEAPNDADRFKCLGAHPRHLPVKLGLAGKPRRGEHFTGAECGEHDAPVFGQESAPPGGSACRCSSGARARRGHGRACSCRTSRADSTTGCRRFRGARIRGGNSTRPGNQSGLCDIKYVVTMSSGTFQRVSDQLSSSGGHFPVVVEANFLAH